MPTTVECAACHARYFTVLPPAVVGAIARCQHCGGLLAVLRSAPCTPSASGRPRSDGRVPRFRTDGAASLDGAVADVPAFGSRSVRAEPVGVFA